MVTAPLVLTVRGFTGVWPAGWTTSHHYRFRIRYAAPGKIVAGGLDYPLAARISAAKRLSLLCVPSTAPVLVTALGDAEPAIREYAAKGLGIISDLSAVMPLTKLAKDQSVSVRLETVTALGRLGDARALDALIVALKDEDPRVQAAAVIALGRIDDAKSTAALRGVATVDGAIGAQALLALARRGDHSITPLCITRAQANDFKDQAVADALAELGDPQAIAVMIKLTQHPDIKIQFCACVGLVRTGDRDAIDQLLAFLHANVQKNNDLAKLSIGMLPTKEALGMLPPLLREDSHLAFSASSILSYQYDYRSAGLPELIQDRSTLKNIWVLTDWLGVRQPGAEVTTMLIDGLDAKAESIHILNCLTKERSWRGSNLSQDLFGPHDPTSSRMTPYPTRSCWNMTPELRERCLAIITKKGFLWERYLTNLGFSGDHSVSKPMREQVLPTGMKQQVDICGMSLGVLADPPAIPDLLKVMEHPDPQARLGGSWGLVGCADPRHQETFQLLLQSLHAENLNVRSGAIAGLGASRDARAVPALLACLKSETDPGCSYFCVLALGLIGDTRAVAPLVALLADTDVSRHDMAAWALGRIGDKSALPALQAAARVKDSVFIAKARLLLGDQHVGRTAVDILTDPDDEFPMLCFVDMTDWNDPVVIGAMVNYISTWLQFKYYIDALGLLHADQAIRPFLNILLEPEYALYVSTTGHNPQPNRQAVARALGVICEGKQGALITHAADVLYRISCRDIDPGTRASAAIALARLHDPRAEERIAWVMHEYVPERNAAIQALWGLNTKSANAWLVEALEDDDPLGRVLAARGLSLHKVPIAAQVLHSQVTTITEPIALQLAIRFSADLHDQTLEPMYARYANAQYETAKMPMVLEAIAALGTCGGVEATDALVALLKSPATVMREAAARALTGTTNAKALAALRALLVAEDATRVRKAAETALGKAK